MRWYIGGTLPLAADLAMTDLSRIPTRIVSAAEYRPGSLFRRTHARLAVNIPNARAEVWPDTTHPLHRERPEDVAATVIELLSSKAS